MPKVKIQFLIVLVGFLSATMFAQSPSPSVMDVMQERIMNAKAQLVVKNYTAAIWELENIRRESNDQMIDRMASVLVMNAYLEQGDYKKAQNFLKELSNVKDQGGAQDFIAVGSQVSIGAKSLFKRYQLLGLRVTDEKLPKFAKNDLEMMRQTLEMVIEQSKAVGKFQSVSESSMALLEEASTARSGLARDTYDATRWENEVVYARQQLKTSGSRVINVVADNPTKTADEDFVSTNEKPVDLPLESGEPTKNEPANTTGEKSKPNQTATKVNDSTLPSDRKVVVVPSAEIKPDSTTETKPSGANVAAAGQPEKTDVDNTETPETSATTQNDDPNSPLTVGSLVGYATKKVNPIYPSQARTMGMTGTVKVQITVDETGNVAKIDSLEGPALLKRAAEDAIRRWEFKPFVRNGQPVKATGFVNFNFNAGL